MDTDGIELTRYRPPLLKRLARCTLSQVKIFSGIDYSGLGTVYSGLGTVYSGLGTWTFTGAIFVIFIKKVISWINLW